MNDLAHNPIAGKSAANKKALGDLLGRGIIEAEPDNLFRRLWGLGYHGLLPIIPPDAPISPKSTLARKIGSRQDGRGKTPGIRKSDGTWISYDWLKRKTEEADLSRWREMGAGVGIRTGRVGENLTLVGIDADARDPPQSRIIFAELERHFGLLPLRIGRTPKGLCPILVRGDFSYARVEFGERDENGRVIDRVEILSDGRQFVAEGIHPGTGRPYRWERPLVPLAELPIVEPAQLTAFLDALRPLLPAASGVMVQGQAKSGPAPDQRALVGDLERVRKAIAVIPNASDIDREEYVRIGIALKAAMGPENEAEACALFVDWARGWEGAGEDTTAHGLAETAETDFRRFHAPFHIGCDYLFAQAVQRSGGLFTAADQFWEERSNVVPLFPDLPTVSAPAPERRAITASPYSFVDPSSLPQRAWIYGDHFIRKFVSVTAAPSKMGKSSLAIAEALAMASGKPLLGVQPHGRFRVWYWNGEDPFDELQKRVEATRQHYGLTPDDIGDRFFLDSGRQTAIVLAQQLRDGPTVAQPIAAEVAATIRANRIDVSMIDPFVSTHRVSENDNGAIDAVAKTWSGIADATNSSIELVHHVRKVNDAEVTIEDARGAVSLIAASRSARVLTRMSKEEARRFGLEDARRSIFRFNDPTSNLAAAPAESQARWMRLVGVSLSNGTGTGPERLLSGDAVGVVTLYTPPVLLNEIENDDEVRILAAVARGRWRKDAQARDAWVGVPIAQALRVDLEDPAEKTRVKGIIAALLKSGRLREVNGYDHRRHQKVFVAVVPRAASEDVFD